MIKLDKLMHTSCVTLGVSDLSVPEQEPSLDEINQALRYAQHSKLKYTSTPQHTIINSFIDDLLDMKLGAMNDNNHCNPKC